MDLHKNYGSLIKLYNPNLSFPIFSSYLSGLNNISLTLFLVFFSFSLALLFQILKVFFSAKHDAKRCKSFQNFNSHFMLLLTLSLSYINLDSSKAVLLEKLKSYFSMILYPAQQISAELFKRNIHFVSKCICENFFKNGATLSNMCCYNTQGKTGKYKVDKINVSIGESSLSGIEGGLKDSVIVGEYVNKQNEGKTKKCLEKKKRISVLYGTIFFIFFFVSPSDALKTSNSSEF